MRENGGEAIFFFRIEQSLVERESEIQKWAAHEFEQNVLGREPKTAVFDCDGTLWSVDSGYGFMVWSLEQGLVSRSTSDWIDERHRAYRSGKVTEVDICGEMVQIYAGLREQELCQAANRYVNEFVLPRVFGEMESLVGKLREQGVELWAVSSTAKWVVAAAVRSFGIAEDHVLGAAVRVVDGLITSDLIGVPTGDGKVTALKQAGIQTPDAVFGNSVHDLAMLEMGQFAYPVNPSPALLSAAETHGWSYFVPAAAEGHHAAVGGEANT